MSNPTGMHTRTAQHFRNVGAQLRNAVNQNSGQNLHSAHGSVHRYQPSHGIAYASNPVHNNYHYFDMHSLAEDYTYQFVKLFLHYMIHPKR
ncbi:hypothetical protein I4U23_003683 [Adineta vaga]|nr:hypothetical protein I4U23_003683 [Adineta vaga]